MPRSPRTSANGSGDDTDAESDGRGPDGARTARAGTRAEGRALRARGHRTLERLLEAGARVFAERGYHAARVDDVVKAAKTSHGTFYLYFTSKEDLFRTLALDVADAMLELARDLPTLRPDADGLAALQDWLERFADLYEQRGAVIRTWTDAEIVDSEFGRIGGALVRQFTQELAQRVIEADARLDPGIAALAIVAMVERSNYYVSSRQLPVARAEMVATLAAVTHASLHGAPVPA